MKNMRFHKFLEDALGSRTKISLLRALCRHPTKEFTQREFSMKFGIPRQNVGFVLKDLSSNNVVSVKTVGKSTLFSANEDSYIFKSIKKMFDDEEKSLDCLIRLISRNIHGARECYLFGSVARGEEKPGSDVDLFMVCPSVEKMTERISKLNGKIIKVFGNQIMPLIIPSDEFEKWKRKHKALYEENIKNGIKIA